MKPRKRTIAAGLLAALALAGCSGDDKPEAGSTGTPPPPPSEAPPSANAVPSAKSIQRSQGLRKPVTYPDKISVAISAIRYVKEKGEGRGVIKGQVKTIFTLKFTNGSAKPLDLNKVKVVAKYGAKTRNSAEPVSYADINDFFGTAAPGQSKTASYAFALPYPEGYKKVSLSVQFDSTHKTAVFVGSLKQ